MILRNFIYTVVLTCSLLFGYVDMMVGANTSTSTHVESSISQFDKAVEVIKKYEGLHKRKGNLVGYGHKILPGDPYKYNQTLTEKQADELLRKDLAKLCERYRSFGKDSLLLSALAYNCGIGVVAKSSVYKKLKAGDRNIKEAYLAHSKYRGKTLSQLKRRRVEEFEILFIE